MNHASAQVLMAISLSQFVQTVNVLIKSLTCRQIASSVSNDEVFSQQFICARYWTYFFDNLYPQAQYKIFFDNLYFPGVGQNLSTIYIFPVQDKILLTIYISRALDEIPFGSLYSRVLDKIFRHDKKAAAEATAFSLFI